MRLARHFSARIVLPGLAVLTGVVWPLAAAERTSDSEPCRERLGVVFRAIQDYRRSHRALPERLRDLVPDYLPNEEQIGCPVAQRVVQQPAQPAAATGAYLYEFESKPLMSEVAQSLGVTLREWRQLQMGRLGSEVPLLRCTNHWQVLNLSFAGRLYESDAEWEDVFSSVVRMEELSLEHLLADHIQLEVVRIPARQPGMPPGLIDLTAYYNGSLKGWLAWRTGSSLASLPAGRTSLQGVAFDIRGVIQLGSRQFNMLHRPAAVSNIVVGLHCRSLVFLHGTIAKEADSATIAQYVLHFEDDSTESFPIAYGREVLDWRADSRDTEKLKNTQRAWSSSFKDETGQTKPVHLYSTRWINRRPDLKVRSIDFVSSLRMSSPFLVAISAEGAAVPARSPAATLNTTEHQ